MYTRDCVLCEQQNTTNIYLSFLLFLFVCQNAANHAKAQNSTDATRLLLDGRCRSMLEDEIPSRTLVVHTHTRHTEYTIAHTRT